jgi:peptidoglycan/LPS O-acetylase OafA/YrhL
LLVVFGTLIIPFLIGVFHIDYSVPYTLSETWYYFVFFFPVLVTYYNGHHLLEPLWSIGVEEVFYLFWAPVFKFARKNILPILLLVIGTKVILLLFPYVYNTPALYNTLVRTYSIESMAIGGIGAYVLFNYKKKLSNTVIYKPLIQCLIYICLLIYLTFNKNITNDIWQLIFRTPIISGILINFLFLYLIIGISIVENSIVNLENKVFLI